MTDLSRDDEAAHWLVLCQSGDMTIEDQRAFDEWLAVAPGASAAYRQAERVWLVAGGLSDDEEIAVSRASDHARTRRRPLVRYVLTGLAASAAMAMLVVPNQLRSFLDAQMASSRGGGQVLSTGANSRASTRLADGSVVTLDVDTKLRVLEMADRRRIQLLRGHAFFRVAKDPVHPFLVTAGDKTVHAIGTAFDVRVEPDAVAVTLVEGKVRVDQPRGLLRGAVATDMTPGKQLVASNDEVWMMSPVDTAEATSWLEDRLTYLPGTLGKIIADVNEGSRRKIVFLGPVNQQQRVIGVFRRGDVDAVVAVLEMKNVAHVVATHSDRIEMMRNETAAGQRGSAR